MSGVFPVYGAYPRSSERSKPLLALVKWKSSVLLCSKTRPAFVKRSKIISYACFSIIQFTLISFDWTMIVPSSTYEIRVVPRPTLLSQNSFMIGATMRADKTGDRADPCPTPTSACLRSEVKLFHIYDMLCSTRYDAKKLTTLGWKPILHIINSSS